MLEEEREKFLPGENLTLVEVGGDSCWGDKIVFLITKSPNHLWACKPSAVIIAFSLFTPKVLHTKKIYRYTSIRLVALFMQGLVFMILCNILDIMLLHLSLIHI